MSTRRKVVSRWWGRRDGELDPGLRPRVAWLWADQDRRARASGHLTHGDVVPECRDVCTCIERVEVRT